MERGGYYPRRRQLWASRRGTFVLGMSYRCSATQQDGYNNRYGLRNIKLLLLQ